MIEQHDEKTMRCPRVGGEVNFRFCRFENNMLPCRWVVGCWQMQMDINEFLDEHYSQEELDRIFVPPKPKIESLVDLMEKVRREKQEDD
ncbi:MAG: hypothetical protein A2Y65_06485 [Deltaproteobacteria bacterium RBG_13_52_11]|nr:MAG: hypothetical protein A2Y65_06485 [Deltaproteobacteria bacterium RBG_13_52_11]